MSGEIGFVANRPTYENIVESSVSSKRSFLIAKPTIEPGSWTLSSGNAYLAPFSKTYRSLIRDVIGVTVEGLTPLARAESLADCIATPNTFYYDPNEEFLGESWAWDDGIHLWDSANIYWDQFPSLYVNLGGVDPNTLGVAPELGFYFTQEGQSQPTLGVDLLGGIGMFEAFTASVPDGWTYAKTDPDVVATVLEDNANIYEGSASVKLDLAGATATTRQAISALVTLIVGKRYRISGSYRRYDDQACVSFAELSDSGETNFLAFDLRSSGTGRASFIFNGQLGEWRRFTLDFIAPFTASKVILGAKWSTGTVTGGVNFDKITLKRVWRQATYEARIAADGVPSSQMGSEGILFAGKTVGVGSVAFENSDGAYDYAVGQLRWIGRKIEHYVGGSTDLGEVDIDDWDRRFTGIVQTIEFSDERVMFQLDDIRAKFHKLLPPNTLSTHDANIEKSARGRVKPLLFGSKNAIRPWRIGFDSVSLVTGEYLIADTTNWAPGIYSIANVYAYVDEDAASKVDTSRRITMNLPQVEVAPETAYNGMASITAASTYQYNFTKIAGDSWTNNFAGSKLLLHGDGHVEWSAGGVTNKAVIVGLSAAHDGALNYTDINFAFMIQADGTMRVYEEGSQKATGTAYTSVTTFRVKRTGTTITYEYNLNVGGGWVVYYTSSTASSAALCMKLSIYTGSATAFAVSLLGFGQVDSQELSGAFVLKENVGPFVVDLSNQSLNFDIGASELTATVPVGLYTATSLAKTITHETKKGATDLVCSYSTSTGLYTIARPSGTLNLKIQSGANKESSIWGLIGFGRGGDKTAASTYAADVAVDTVVSIDTNRIIRCDALGYKDDAIGTYTGTANSLIQIGSDIARALIRVWLSQPASIDDTSFSAARVLAPEQLAIYLNEFESSVGIFNRLEASNLADIIVGGDAKVVYAVYVYDGEEVPVSRRLESRDLLEPPLFTRINEEVFSAVSILFDKRPDNGEWRRETAVDTSKATIYDSQILKEIETYVLMLSTAESLATRTLAISQSPSLRVHIVSGTRLFKSRIGDIVTLTLNRAPSLTGLLANQPFRILSIEPDVLAGRVTVDLVEA